jgi:hypothetical protein
VLLSSLDVRNESLLLDLSAREKCRLLGRTLSATHEKKTDRSYPRGGLFIVPSFVGGASAFCLGCGAAWLQPAEIDAKSAA